MSVSTKKSIAALERMLRVWRITPVGNELALNAASLTHELKRMKQPIIGYHKDDEAHWVAELACGHCQHVRHQPPWVERYWVTTLRGRDSMLGFALECKKCDAGAPCDTV